MRKLFSIVLYIIAGIFAASIISVSYSLGMIFFVNGIETVILSVLFTLSVLFFLLASLLYPSINYYKPVYITLLTSVIIITIGSVNQYFVLQSFQNSDINTPITERFSDIDFTYNIPLAIGLLVSLVLITFYFYLQSQKLDKLFKSKETQILTKKKRWLAFFVSFGMLFVSIYILSKHFSSDTMYDDFNVSEYAHVLQGLLDNNTSDYVTAIVASRGYRNYLENENEFLSYDTIIKDKFYKNTQQDTSNISSKQWVNLLHESNLTENTFDIFFEQLDSLDTYDKDQNTTWSILSEKLPKIYIEYMDRELKKIAVSSIAVPLVELYKKDGTTIEDMNLSRGYLVSEVYRRISDFCDDASSTTCDPEEYARKAAENSALNPSALFLYAYHTDDSKLVVDLLSDVLALTKVSDRLLENSKFAVYNNLGYNIYLSSQKNKYDDALRYLKKAYELNNEAVYSLSSMSGIYRDRKDYKSAYNIMEAETYKFLHASNKVLLEKEKSYWVFVNSIIETSYVFKDYNTTKYACGKYLELHDSEYDKCDIYLRKIEETSNGYNTKPIYSFWKLYTEPEVYNMIQKDKKIEGTLNCGTVMTYSDSLKYKSTSRTQDKLLEKFTVLYTPHKVPNTLKELIKIEEKLGADSYVISFYLDPESREEFFEGTFSYDNKALNSKVAKHFLPLAHIDGTGANAALWLTDENITDLENAPIVEFGSEGQIDIVAKNLKDFIYMLSFGIEPMDGGYSQYLSINEEYYRRENFMAYRKWLKDVMNIEPVKDLEVWGTPKKIEKMQEEAQTLYRDRLFQWLYRFIPEHDTVKKGKKDADTFNLLMKNKKRLLALIDKNATSATYCLLARNEQRLDDIDRSLRDDVSMYYKKAFELDNNVSIIEEWAKFMSNFSYNKNKANLYIKTSEIYAELGNIEKEKKYLSLGLDLYKISVEKEENAEKKMQLYENIAEVYKDTNQTSNAIVYYKKALAIKADDKLWKKKYYYVDLAKLYEEKKEYLLTIENYKNAENIVKKQKDKALYNYYIADNYLVLKEYAKALIYARKSLTQAPENTTLKENCLTLIEEIKHLKH